MKFSFSLERKNKPAKTGGELIRSSVVKPEHAAILREFRESNLRMRRMYDAAITTNLNADFQATIGSANAEILTSLFISRGRARTLTKDNPTAKGILRTFKNNVCGDDPFRLEMKAGSWSADGKTFTPDLNTNRKVEQAWREAGQPKNCTVRREQSRMEMYHTVEASALRDGSILARHHRGYKNKFGYAVELIDSDRLQESYMGRTTAGNAIRFSIERDKFNAPVAYYILTRHPGDLFQYNGDVPNTWRERVPAEDIIHFNNLRDRAEQDIGFPEFDSVIQHLHRDRQFDVAHVTAAIWASCKPFFIIQEFPTGMPYAGDPATFFNSTGGTPSVNESGSPPGPGDGKGGGADKMRVAEPGTGEILNWGQKPMLVDPKFPIEAATGFKRDNLLATASGMGLSYGAVSSDFEKYSFSSARAAETPQRDYFKVRQAHMVLSFVQDHFNEWLKYAILSGQLDIPISRLEELQAAAVFHGKRWPYVNPLQDAQTDIMLLEARLKSPQEILAESENGRNYEDVISDIAEFQDSAESHGVELLEVNKPTLSKGEPNQEQELPEEPEPELPEKKNGKKNRFKLNGHGKIR